MNLPKVLLEQGLLSAADRAALEADLAKKVPIVDALAMRGVSLADALAAAGEAHGLPARVLPDPPADEKAFPYIPLDSARHYGFVPIRGAAGGPGRGLVGP